MIADSKCSPTQIAQAVFDESSQSIKTIFSGSQEITISKADDSIQAFAGSIEQSSSISSAGGAATLYSSILLVSDCKQVSVTVTWAGDASLAASVQLQGSNTNSGWKDLLGSAITVSGASGADSAASATLPYKYIRVKTVITTSIAGDNISSIVLAKA